MEMKNLRNRHLHWDEDKLCYKKMVLTELIPHETVPDHYHLKFFWREEKTPEFFNIVNARENARLYSLQKMSQSPSVPVLMRLNEVGATHAA